MASLNIFDDDAFSMSELTESILVAPHQPRMLGTLGWFSERPIRTLVANVEKKSGKLALIPTANRGTMNRVRSSNPRKMYPFAVPHIPYFQDILADDVQGIRAFGSETELESVQDHVNEQMVGMRDDHEVTWEFHRIGALKGVILDADGVTVLHNLFTVFGMTQEQVNFVGDNEDIEPMITLINRTIAGKLGNSMFSDIVAICGDDYFDAITRHPAMRESYALWRDGEFRRMTHLGPAWLTAAANGFQFHNVLFINYRGQIGDVEFIASNEAYYVPNGLQRFFSEYLAPADTMEAVNTKGKRLYAMQERMDFDKGVTLHTQSNYLAMCTQPDAIVKSVYTATATSSSSA